jgi:hypothetical protein
MFAIVRLHWGELYMSVWSIWKRWFGKKEHWDVLHEPKADERQIMHAAKHEKGLQAELRHATLTQGCFSDRELRSN